MENQNYPQSSLPEFPAAVVPESVRGIPAVSGSEPGSGIPVMPGSVSEPGSPAMPVKASPIPGALSSEDLPLSPDPVRPVFHVPVVQEGDGPANTAASVNGMELSIPVWYSPTGKSASACRKTAIGKKYIFPGRFTA